MMIGDTITSAGTSTTVNCGINYCPQKLPCGICRLTMTTCPMSGYTIGYTNAIEPMYKPMYTKG
ncbi:MAG: hypothetical protein Q4C03_04270, partial [bacterium]|nr:hypothetical protein [bacterium]